MHHPSSERLKREPKVLILLSPSSQKRNMEEYMFNPRHPINSRRHSSPRLSTRVRKPELRWRKGIPSSLSQLGSSITRVRYNSYAPSAPTAICTPSSCGSKLSIPTVRAPIPLLWDKCAFDLPPHHELTNSSGPLPLLFSSSLY